MASRRRRKAHPVAAAQMVKRYRRAPGGSTPPPADESLAAIRDLWENVAGEAVAAKARPVRRSQAGLVTVACVDAIWAQALSSETDDLLDRLRAAAGGDAVSALRFVPDEHAFRRAVEAAPAPPPRPPVTPEKLAAAEALVQGVADPVLRDLLVRAAARAPTREERAKST